MKTVSFLFAAAVLTLNAAVTEAQMTYGMPITADIAKNAAATAIAEAKKNNWSMAVAIVDPAGDLVYFERMPDASLGGINVSIGKARSAARFRRPTKDFQQMVTDGGPTLRVLGLEGAVPIDGGVPLVVGGKVVGAVGISGGTAAQDGQVAEAAAAALK